MNEKLNKTNNQSAVFGVKTAIALILIAFMLLSSLVYGLGLLISPLNANGPHSTQQLGNHHETVTTGRTPQAPANFRLFGQENGRPVLAWWSCNYAQWSSMRWRSSDGRSSVLHSRIGTSTIRVDGPMLPNVSYTFYVRGYNSANLRGSCPSF